MQGATTRRPSLFGGLTAIAGVGALVLGLAVVDERVRVQLARVFSGKAPTDEIASVGNSFRQLMAVTWQAVADQSIENAPLVVFSVAALVLVVWMTRT
jgi:hypothetical protein